MTWDYRTMRHEDEEEISFEIHEVYYNDKDQIVAWTKEPVAPVGETIKELRQTLKWMKKATKAPILDYNMEPEGAWDIGEDDWKG